MLIPHILVLVVTLVPPVLVHLQIHFTFSKLAEESMESKGKRPMVQFNHGKLLKNYFNIGFEIINIVFL